MWILLQIKAIQVFPHFIKRKIIFQTHEELIWMFVEEPENFSFWRRLDYSKGRWRRLFVCDG